VVSSHSVGPARRPGTTRFLRPCPGR
jgi:hypothetical protein